MSGSQREVDTFAASSRGLERLEIAHLDVGEPHGRGLAKTPRCEAIPHVTVYGDGCFALDKPHAVLVGKPVFKNRTETMKCANGAEFRFVFNPG